MLRAIRFLLRLTMCAVIGLGGGFGATFAIGEWVAPLTWTTESAVDREWERSQRAHRRWGTEDLEIAVTRDRFDITYETEARALHAVTLEASSCVSYRVALTGTDAFVLAGITISEDGEVVARAGGGAQMRPHWKRYLELFVPGRWPREVGRQIVWCSPTGGEVELAATFGWRGRERLLERLGGSPVVHLVTGQTPGGSPLLWGHDTRQSEGGRARWRTHVERLDTTRRIGEPVTSRWRRGVPLLPATEAVWHALLDASAHETGVLGNPGTDADLRDVDPPWGRGSVLYPRANPPNRTPPVILWGEHTRRVVAAVDLGDLGAPCVRVALTRPDPSRVPPTMWSLAIPSGAMRALEREMNTSSEVACPAEGLRLYLVGERDRADYRIDVLEEDAPDDAVATPSEFAGGMPLEGEGPCAGGDQDACWQIALHEGFWPAFADRRDSARARLEELCEGGRGRACVARQLVGPINTAALNRLCDNGPARRMACFRLGEALRDSYRNATYQDAHRARALSAFQRACDAGEEGGCHNVTARFP